MKPSFEVLFDIVNLKPDIGWKPWHTDTRLRISEPAEATEGKWTQQKFQSWLSEYAIMLPRATYFLFLGLWPVAPPSLICRPAVSALSKDFSKIQILGLHP